MTESQDEGPLAGRVADARLRAYRRVRQGVANRFNLAPKRASAVEFSNVKIAGDVLVYFADEAARLYQMEQWLPVLETLDQRHKVLIMCRQSESFHALKKRTSMSVMYVRALREVNTVMQSNEFKVALYVNNSFLNFHPLMFPTLLHIHLNHGESDKISMASNQAKAYDQVFVAGQAAVDRYRRNLINFDGSNLVEVGRPQLDVTYPRVLEPSSRPTVLYAPTWEGDRDEMNYTSLDCYGRKIVRQLIDAHAYRIVYKPHPRVADFGTSTVEAHSAIVAELKKAIAAEPDAGHRIEMNRSILAMFAGVDAMISDVSSVGLDFLYMATDKPLFLTDRHNNRPALIDSAPIAAGSYIVDRSTLATLPATLADALAVDSQRDERHRIRTYYFGNLEPGQSTARFMEAIDAAIAQRDAAMLERRDTEHATQSSTPMASA